MEERQKTTHAEAFNLSESICDQIRETVFSWIKKEGNLVVIINMIINHEVFKEQEKYFALFFLGILAEKNDHAHAQMRKVTSGVDGLLASLLKSMGEDIKKMEDK